MEIKEKLLSVFKGDKRIRIFIIIAIIGVLLIMLSEVIPNNTSSKKSDNDISVQEYIEYLEAQTEDTIGSISGVGKCKVMITIVNTNESVFAQNSDISSGDGSSSKKYEYVFYDGDSGDEPVLIKEYMPKVQGVAVVCQGGDNPYVVECITSAVSSLFDISTSKISISKLG